MDRHKEVAYRPLYFTVGHCEKNPTATTRTQLVSCALAERPLIIAQASEQWTSWLQPRRAVSSSWFVHQAGSTTYQRRPFLKRGSVTKRQKNFVQKAKRRQMKH